MEYLNIKSNDNINNSNNSNNLLNLKIPNIFYPIIFFVIGLIILLFVILYKVPISTNNLPKTDKAIAANVISITSFVLILLFLSVMFLPNLKSIKELFQQITNVTYVVFYTIGLILFFTFSPKSFIDNYAKYIVPLSVLFGGFSFYKSLQKDYVIDFNVNYERIKMIILVFCLITSYIVYYNKDPGGYISKYFGFSLLLTILLAVFGFLYLVTLFTLPDSNTPNQKTDFLQNFSKFSVFGSVSFILFLIIMTSIIATYPGGFFNDKISAPVLIILLMICIIWAILLIGFLFPEFSNGAAITSKMNLFKKSLLTLFGLVVSGLVIFWLVYTIQNFSNQSNVTSLVLNILIVLIILALFYKIINVNLPVGNTKKNSFFNLLFNLIFYIPCLFSGLLDTISKLFVGEINSNNTVSLLILLIATILTILYNTTPKIYNKITTQGGKLLVNEPVNIDTLRSLGTYEVLNNSSEYKYQYAISFWVFLDSKGANMNAAYSKYTSILNFGNKPNLLYKGSDNTIIVTMDQTLKEKDHKISKLTDTDENGNVIICKYDNLPLQKWNNFIINYNGGILDIFLNGELIQSVDGVVPYYALENLTVGEKNGLKGGICNVNYFSDSLKSSNIYYLYNTVKNNTPPIVM
jgi:hypothetical protein